MPRPLFSFEMPSAVAAWFAIDDAVMGGVSRSALRQDACGFAVFEGVVSLERNGGFASVRSRPGDLGDAAAKAYCLEVAGDGHQYKFNLRTDDGLDGVLYQAAFSTEPEHWTRIEIPLAALQPSFRGHRAGQAPPLDPARVRQAGLMIAGGQAGPFALAVRSIETL